MDTINGKYTAKRNGIEYEYEITVRSAIPENTLIWEAKIRRDNQLAGTPSGQMLGLGKIDGVQNLIRKWIESCIEDRVGVDW